ncbi:UDP-galactose transporter 1 [Lecanosticta acicola]|uniref:UDP-galactose transporter 1 n=1 Tax=Lecanosticta acicola TaxID=111012 RepID=A0AAI8YZH3_9PEZI|nr:UDP-galactose transporter 1 [Lecanosticta acicola]
MAHNYENEKLEWDQHRASLTDQFLQDEHVDEKHEPELAETPAPVEYTVPVARKLLYLGLYFILNLGLTLSNKAVMQKARFPWMLTVLHTTSTSIGCLALLATGHLRLTKLGSKENLILVAFSVLFTMNIAISNASLALVSVPFHQVLRSTCPIATILIYRVLYARTYSQQTYLSMIPLVLGVGLATYGDYQTSLIGFLLTLLGVFLAAVKTVASNRLMTGSLQLSGMEILLRMSPLAVMHCLLIAAFNGELAEIRGLASRGFFEPRLLVAIVGNGLMAFLLNIVSFQTNKVAGALTVTICGNVKQCLTILLGIVLFNVEVTPLNGVGMAIAVCGAAWYSKVELARKTQQQKPLPTGSERV